MTSEKKKTIKNVGVFCSSRLQQNPIYAQHAEEVGRLLGESGFNLVYGGGTSGLMGVVAKAARDNGARVFGVITHAFKNSAYYEALDGATEKVVAQLPTRKAWMMRKADAFITLGGGIGTLDEKWEIAAHNDMLIAARSTEHLKPIIVVNTNGIYDTEKVLMRTLIDEGFIYEGREKMIRAVESPLQAIEKLKTWSAEGVMRGVDLATAKPEPKVHAVSAPKP
jgi:uncharacterized protein (TIGR00730 family)